MESRIILYHSDIKEKCKEFVIDKDKLIISGNSKDDIWLGKGMYFWDNKGNAKWWRKKQVSRNPNIQYSIVAVNVVANNLLDLTDFDIYMSLNKLWNDICKKCDMDKDVPLGQKLNFFYDVFNFGEKYDLIKVFGKYNFTPNFGIFKFDYSTSKAEPTIGAKCIYSIRNKKCIIEKELVKEEEL